LLAYSLIILILGVCSTAEAATGRILKVLPFYLDHKGRHSLAPSLYERDAYQAFLRQNPQMRSGMRFATQWKMKKKSTHTLVLRLELRGVTQGNLPRWLEVEQVAEPGRWFSTWDAFLLVEEDYLRFGEVTAWRVSLWERGPWEEDVLLDEQSSFLW
jgi:hypothetical protein